MNTQAPGPQPTVEPQPDDAVRCTAETLHAFNPGTEVTERTPVRRTIEKPGPETQIVSDVACEAKESDERCMSRALVSVENTLPHGERSARILYDGTRVVATFEVNGQSQERTFDSSEALQHHLDALKQAGHTVSMKELSMIADKSGERRVVVTVLVPAHPEERFERFTTELEVVFTEDAHIVLGNLFERAEKAGVFVKSWELMEKGRAQMSILCSRELNR